MRESKIRRSVSCILYPVSPRGFTLVEMLTATTLSLIIMASVITIFGNIGSRVSDSRSTMEMAERLRATATQLQQDLAGVTASMCPPEMPENQKGYFEYIEGPRGLWGLEGRTGYGLKDAGNNPIQFITAVRPDPTNPANSVLNGGANLPFDSTVGDNDDILMFTTRSTAKPFIGRGGSATTFIQSPVAEVAWFVRGHTLYRRVLLVLPAQQPGYRHDRGRRCRQLLRPVRRFGPLRYGQGGHRRQYLGRPDKAENRYAHCGNSSYNSNTAAGTFPFDVRAAWQELGLPTLAECSLKSGNSYLLATSSPGWTIQSAKSPLPASTTSWLTKTYNISVLDYWDSFETAKAAYPVLANVSTALFRMSPPPASTRPIRRSTRPAGPTM